MQQPNATDRQADFVMQALDKYERPLTRYAARLLSGDLSAARDVVQHAFLKLCEQQQQAVQHRLAPWLYTVCRNRAIDLIRGRNSEEQFDQQEPNQPGTNDRVGIRYAANPAHIVEQADFSERLRSLIDDLPGTQREVIEMWSQGLTSQEIGEVIGKKSGAVRIALHRAIQHLREHESVKRWKGELV